MSKFAQSAHQSASENSDRLIAANPEGSNPISDKIRDATRPAIEGILSVCPESVAIVGSVGTVSVPGDFFSRAATDEECYEGRLVVNAEYTLDLRGDLRDQVAACLASMAEELERAAHDCWRDANDPEKPFLVIASGRVVHRCRSKSEASAYSETFRDGLVVQTLQPEPAAVIARAAPF